MADYYAEPIAGGTLYGSVGTPNVIYAKVASGANVRAGMVMCWTSTNGVVEPVDSSDKHDAMNPFAGIAMIDLPTAKLDKSYDVGIARGYTLLSDDGSDSSSNWVSPTDKSWADIDRVIPLLTRGQCEVWMASGTSGTAVAGAAVVPAHDLVGAKFDGMVRVYDDSATASGSMGNFRPIGTIIEGTTKDIAGNTYGTTAAKAIAKVKISLFG